MKLKKLGSLAIALALIVVPLSSSVYADNANISKEDNLGELEHQVKVLAEKYGFEMDGMETVTEYGGNDNSLKFNNIEELESFFKEASEDKTDMHVNMYSLLDELGEEHILNQDEFISLLESQNIEYTTNEDGSLSFDYDSLTVNSSMFNKTVEKFATSKVQTTGTTPHTFRQDTVDFTLFYKRYMDMKYEWKRVPQNGKPGSRQFVRVFNRNAYPVGFYHGDFINKKYSQTYTNGRHTVTNKVNGLWKITAQIGPFQPNFTKPQTWTFALTIY